MRWITYVHIDFKTAYQTKERNYEDFSIKPTVEGYNTPVRTVNLNLICCDFLKRYNDYIGRLRIKC